MRTTLKDIAAYAGVSIASVSLILNNKPHRLSNDTCEKVFKAAEELHYRPNVLAKGLITNRTLTIGLILPDITNAYFATIAKQIQIQLQEADYNLFLCNTNDYPEKELSYVNSLLDRGVDGIILATATGSSAAKCQQIMLKASRPLIFLDRTSPGVAAHSICPDHELGGYIATKHLIELGHRRIGCITGPMSLQSSKERFFGYIRALQEAGISFNPEFIQEADFRILSDYSKLETLLQKNVTAIFAHNDLIAYGVYQQAVQHGFVIPKDFSLVGCDDLPFSQLMAVPLTTVVQPIKELSEGVVRLMLELLSDYKEKKIQTIKYAPQLVVRSSTAEYHN